MNVALRVESLQVTAKDDHSTLVSGVSFALRKGRVLALLGESGCGKTTICNAVMKLLDPQRFEVSGGISISGEDITTKDDCTMQKLRGRKVGLIVQNPMTAFNPALKIGAQMVETLRVHTKCTKQEGRTLALKALAEMNLDRPEQILNSYPHTMSGGMLQRIVIALSLMLSPDVILSDEATTALDVVNQNMVLDELARMKARRIGILLITHDLGVAARLADEVCVMKNGRIIERGSIQQILNNPVEPYTKEFIHASVLRREGMP